MKNLYRFLGFLTDRWFETFQQRLFLQSPTEFIKFLTLPKFETASKNISILFLQDSPGRKNGIFECKVEVTPPFKFSLFLKSFWIFRTLELPQIKRITSRLQKQYPQQLLTKYFLLNNPSTQSQ